MILARFIALLLLFCSANARPLICTYCYNTSDFIELQFKALKKFLVNEFDYIVFNDAKEKEFSIKIEKTCEALGIRHIKVPQTIHSQPYLERPQSGPFHNFDSPNVRNSTVVQWSLNNYGFKHNDIVVLLDGDIFLTKKFDINKFLEGYQIGAYLRPCYEYPIHDCKIDHPEIPTIKYLWIGLVFLDIPNLPNCHELNFNCGIVENSIQVDAGGFTWNYLKKYPGLKIKSIDRIRTRELSVSKLQSQLESVNFAELSKELAYHIKNIDNIKGIEFYNTDTFVHYFGGTNYQHLPFRLIDSKNLAFKNFFDQIL